MGAPASALMAVILDFERYPEFLPEVTDARVLLREPSRGEPTAWEVTFEVVMIRALRYTLRLQREDPLTLRWSLVEGRFHANEGAWRIEPTSEHTCHASWEVELQPGFYLPGGLLRTLRGTRLKRTLARFAQRAREQAIGATWPRPAEA